MKRIPTRLCAEAHRNNPWAVLSLLGSLQQFCRGLKDVWEVAKSLAEVAAPGISLRLFLRPSRWRSLGRPGLGFGSCGLFRYRMFSIISRKGLSRHPHRPIRQDFLQPDPHPSTHLCMRAMQIPDKKGSLR